VAAEFMLTLMVNRSPETSVAVQSKRLLSLTLASGQSTVMVVSFIVLYILAIEASTSVDGWRLWGGCRAR
jgi:hypothetical protein